MFNSKPLDYLEVEHEKDGKKVEWFRVARILAEHGMHASLRVGNTHTLVTARHLPTSVQMRLDNLGLRRVAAHDN